MASLTVIDYGFDQSRHSSIAFRRPRERSQVSGDRAATVKARDV
jgi:hypothetical protein